MKLKGKRLPEQGEAARKDLESSKSRSGVNRTINYFRQRMFKIFALSSLVGHIFLLSQGRSKPVNEMAEKWQEKNQALLAAIEDSNLITKIEKEILITEQQAIQERNSSRLEKIAKLTKEQEALKKQFLKKPEVTPEFILQYDKVFEGVEEKIVEVAQRNFDSLMISRAKDLSLGKPTYEDLQKIVNTFRPAGPQEDTIAHPSDALALRSLGIIGDCEAGYNLYTMGLIRAYPDLKNNLLVQQFGNHIRLLYQVLEESTIYILEGEVSIFPDQITETERSRVMPLEEYWKNVLGVAEKELKNVKFYGPPAKEIKPNGPTDRINKPEQQEVLGHYPGAWSKPIEPEKRKEQLKNINDQLKAVASSGELNLEVEILPKILTAEKAQEMVEKGDYGLLRYYEKIDPQSLETIFKDSGFQEKSFADTSIGLEITEINDEFIQTLKRVKGEITLRFLNPKILTPENLKKLQEIQVKKISFFQVKNLTVEVAQELAKLNIEILVIIDLEELNEKVAQELARMKNIEALNLVSLLKITAKTAEELAKLNISELVLENLSTLSEKEAEKFATIKVKDLWLGLSTVNAKTLKGLAKLNVDTLNFHALKSLDAKAAKEFKNINVQTLQLIALKTIDAETVRALANSKIKKLNLKNVESLNVETAEELAKWELEDLDLSGLKSITPEVAEKLAQFKGKILRLNGKLFEKPEISNSLNKVKSSLVLHNTESISVSMAKNLANFKGDALAFNNLKFLSPEAARELSNLEINNIVIYTNFLSRATAIEMAQWKSKRIFLSNIHNLTPEVAKEIIKWPFEVIAVYHLEASEEVRAILRENPNIRGI